MVAYQTVNRLSPERRSGFWTVWTSSQSSRRTRPGPCSCERFKRARGSLFWERLWPALAVLATALGLFLAFSWAGVWLVLPPLARAIGLVLFVVVTFVAAAPLAMVRLPSVADGLRRLDRNSGETHRPATAVADEIAANSHDPVAQALWRAHVERALISARKLKAGWPSPRLSMRDPMALRALVLLLAASTFFAAGGERWKRMTAAFDWHGVVAPANFRIDAWVTPPNYTGSRRSCWPGLRPGETAQASAPVAVPAGSELVIRSSGNVHFDVERKGGLEAVPSDARVALPAGSEERRFLIKDDGSATLHGVGSSELAWTFTAMPDRAPKIELIGNPERQARGSLRIDYRVEDDYGVVEAHADFALKDDDASGRRASAVQGAGIPAHVCRRRATRSGAAQTTRDLTAHPWAGAKVEVTLVARDEAGNEGRSESAEVQLPQRIFVKPVARALIEQRRILALDADAKPIVLTALDALTIAPESFTPEVGVYLGLRAIYFDLAHANTDDQLREVVARMWDMAVHLEEGNVSQAEQALRQAQDALRQALERGATDQELKKLMDQLRAAMDKYLQALAEEMRKNPQQLSRPLDRNTRMLSERDFKNMLDRLENLARSGNKDAARRLLDEMQSMLENLQTARPGAQGDEGDDDMMSALDELGDMIRKQQQLRDKTFKQGQDSRRDRQPGAQGQRQFGDLRQDQQGLRDRLNKLLDQLRQHGLGNPESEAAGPGRKRPGQQRYGSARQRRRSHGRGGRRARPGRCRKRGRQPGPRARGHAQGRARAGAVDAAERHGHGSGAARPQRPPAR